jgi:hypothetical protein
LFLVQQSGQIVSREELRRRIWGEATFVEFDQGLYYCIRQIRLALRDDASKPVYVETLPKQGYRFIAPITANDCTSDSVVPVVESAADPTPPVSLVEPVTPPPAKQLPWKIWGAALAVLAARLGEDPNRRPENAVADPQLLLSLFEQADAFRRPERFAQWLEVLAARRSAASCPADETAALLARLRNARTAAAAVQLSAAELKTHQGPQIGALLRERRLTALGRPEG